MSTSWGESTSPSVGQNDSEHIKPKTQNKTPEHDPQCFKDSSPSISERMEKDIHNQEIISSNLLTPIMAEPAPDGGLRAWSQVLMGHLMNMNGWGFINSYGIFEAYYVDTLGLSASAVAWTGSIQVFILFFIGAFSGRALDAGYYRHVLILGCFCQVFGIFMASLSTQYWQLFLAQGVCQGIGNGLVFAPTIGLVSTYFVRKRSLVISLVAAGSATGAIIYTLIAQHLLHQIGFPWTMRVMGFVVLFNQSVMIALARPRLISRRSGPLFDFPAFKERPYSLFVIGMFLTLWPLYYAFTYINLYATNIIGVTSSTSLTYLLILNAVGVPGRVIPALIADRFTGPLNTLIILIAMLIVMNFVWIRVKNAGGLLAFVIIYGLINAGVQGIFLSSLSSLTVDLSKMGTRIGMVFTIVAFATLTGSPIAGALIDRDNGGFLGVQIFGGGCMAVGLCFVVCARAAQTGWTINKRM